MRLVIISDTHGKHRRMTAPIPDGDVLIHCGDFTHRGKQKTVVDFNKWLGKLPHTHKIVIAGNHDFCCENYPEQSAKSFTNATYLFDSSTTINGLKFYGSPWSPWFNNWAFNVERGDALRKIWEKIPDDTDILLTHTPPFGHRDFVPRRGEGVGCRELLARVNEVKPRAHCFGHIHEGYGISSNDDTQFVNASICTIGKLEAVNRPFIYDVS